MKNKLTRIDQLETILSKGKAIARDELCKKLEISEVTLRRYIGILRESGYEIVLSKGLYLLNSKATSLKMSVYSKSQQTEFSILSYVVNNNPCSRESIIRKFTSKKGTNNRKITIRYLDMHLNKLIKKRLINKTIEASGIKYTINENLLETPKIADKQAQDLITSLSIANRYLPYEPVIESIITKLINGFSNNLANPEMEKNIGFFQKHVFIDQQEQYSLEDENIRLLWDCCKNNSWIEVCFNQDRYKDIESVNNEKSQKLLAVSILYDWDRGSWYLIHADKNSIKKHSMLRIEKIKSFKKINNSTINEKKECQDIIDNLISHHENTIGLGYDRPFSVHLMFFNHFNVIEKAISILSRKNGKLNFDHEGNLYFKGEMEGLKDILAWIRGFGSSVVVLEPETLRKKHIESMLKILSSYGEEVPYGLLE